ncbi:MULTISPECIES: transposase [Candidatus Nitrosocaldus]|nr:MULTISPECIES: transposase [Candidatus Nitrosocaldus]
MVKRGEILLSFNALCNWRSELKRMNRGKEGRRFIYPNSFIIMVAYIKVYLNLPYRQCEGILSIGG